MASADPPPISALFLVDFDVKAGYTIAWKRALPGLEIDGLVEYKSLPSGLHTVSHDLIYFVHDGAHAGLSAFVNEPREEEELRHARMIAVGILVPLSYGRLGRSWRHAQSLKDMASRLAKNRDAIDVLEAYWDANKVADDYHNINNNNNSDKGVANAALSPLHERPLNFRDSRSRSVVSNAALFHPDHKLSPFHPAWSLTGLLDRFGPLIFPIHRAALLRQRILISCHAPVNQVCDFVYNLSVLSNLPLAVIDALPAPSPPHRLRPLFNIGVHDIPFLLEDLEASKRNRNRNRSRETVAQDDAGSGWIACTTDSILAMKDTLWDMLITMPPDHAAHAKEPVWPVVECPRGRPVKATQRDLRRFHALRSGLVRLASTKTTSATSATSATNADPSSSSSSSSSPSSCRPAATQKPDYATDKLVEPLTWTALAYSGFMWWASAGEQIRSEEQDEAAQDAALLIDDDPLSLSPSAPLPSPCAPPHNPNPSLASLSGPPGAEARVELAIIAYFHRLTAQMLSVLADLVDASSSSDEDALPQAPDRGEEDHEGHERLLPRDFEDPGANPVTVDSRAVEAMGLDVWSGSDAVFVREATALYFGRQASIDGKGIEICGVRVC